MKTENIKILLGFVSIVLAISGGSFLGLTICFGTTGKNGLAILCLIISILTYLGVYITGFINEGIKE